jgi:hypothetical protein
MNIFGVLTAKLIKISKTKNIFRAKNAVVTSFCRIFASSLLPKHGFANSNCQF